MYVYEFILQKLAVYKYLELFGFGSYIKQYSSQSSVFSSIYYILPSHVFIVSDTILLRKGARVLVREDDLGYSF